MMEYAILNVPGFKILYGSGNSWVRLHTGEKATSPYVNPERWWTGIENKELAEYIALSTKIKYWSARKRKRDFDSNKFMLYKAHLEKLLSDNSEGRIISLLSFDGRFNHLLPKTIQDIFIF